jgi:hypothetical protein
MKINEAELARTIVELAKQINIKGANQSHYVMVRDSTERDLVEEAYQEWNRPRCSVCNTTENVKYVGGCIPFLCGSSECIPF